MSTRCQVQVIQEGAGWDEKVTLYHHCDGYPTNMLTVMAAAFDRFQKKGWELGRAGRVASFLCAMDPGDFEPEDGHELHGDIEFYYKLYAMNESGGSMAERGRWEVEVFEVCKSAAGDQLRELCGRLEIREAAEKETAERIERRADEDEEEV